MSDKADYSKILKQAYDQFLLPLGGKKIPTPYRINIPHQPDRTKYGKSDPDTLIANTLSVAHKEGFDLDSSSEEEIRQFMQKNQLGIDCSGFVYHALDYLLKKIGLRGMEGIGFPSASKTDVRLLTSDIFTVPVPGTSQIRPGDLIKLIPDQEGFLHILLVVGVDSSQITCAHSTDSNLALGVGKGIIDIVNPHLNLVQQKWSKNLSKDRFESVRRLKALR